MKGQRPEKDEVCDGECRRVRADAQGHYQDRGDRKTGCARERSPGVKKVLPQNVPMDRHRVEQHVEERLDPQHGGCQESGCVPTALRKDFTHLIAVFPAKRGWIEVKQSFVKTHHALPGTNPLERASLTSCIRRLASARATAVPNGVIR